MAGKSKKKKATKKGKFKMKTHKGTAKRFKLSGSGKLMRTKGGKSHFRRRASARTKRQFDEMLVVKGKGFNKRIRRLAPYMGKYRANPSTKTAK